MAYLLIKSSDRLEMQLITKHSDILTMSRSITFLSAGASFTNRNTFTCTAIGTQISNFMNINYGRQLLIHAIHQRWSS